MLLVYRLLTLLVAILVLRATLRAKTIGQQVTGGLVLIPLVLRILLVK